MNQRTPARTQVQVATKQRIDVAFGIGIAMYTAGSLAILAGLAFVFASLPAIPPPPARIESVAAFSTADAVTIRWTAPGDDQNVGQAAQYDLRYSTALLSEANFTSGTRVLNLAAPLVAGQTETVTVGGLQPSRTYYFALKAADEVPNWSGLSNVATAATTSVACTPNWSCTEWSACQVDQRTRSCSDLAGCGTDLNRPLESQTCTPSPEPDECQESWSCTAWSDCRDDRQARTCQDGNTCGTTTHKPAETAVCGGDAGNPPVATADDVLVVGPARRAAPIVRVYDRTPKRVASFNAFPRTMTSGVSLAVGDTDGDSDLNVVVGTGSGASPEVRVFSLAGRRLASLRPFASRSRAGVNVTLADIDGDQLTEILATPASGRDSSLAVYRYNATAQRYDRLTSLTSLMGSAGGMTLASGDLDGNGADEVVVAPPRGARSTIRVFTYDVLTRRFRETSSFSPFGSSDRSGLQVATGDANNDGSLDIITSRGRGTRPTVRVVTATGRSIASFNATSASFRGGVTVAAMDTNKDGADEILTAVSEQGPPGVFVFKFDTVRRRFVRVRTLSPFGTAVRYGLRLAAPPAI